MTQNSTKTALLDAALPHVAFDGWTDAILTQAAEATGVPPAEARALFPRGAIDLALAFHARGDAAMQEAFAAADLSTMRYSEKIAHLVRLRLEAIEGEREAVRRAAALFALPQNAPHGAAAIWGTADSIWSALGDTSEDANWYSKRATLSAVYSATLLYWLGDESEGHTATWAFLDRRIENVMQIEKLKGGLRSNPLTKPLMAGPEWLASRIHAPRKTPPADMPGHIKTPN
ncbi:COQ9 family protein [Vannielia sp.]|uniref:COQ9 family protein n=1 Tax=Vannielia sp. TaxID=2813045 RepID=UPI0026191733|nr:COQ9 family protein [Vannielia sp.]MDF1873745.1 COQ9 family protein [Vannielia sp.]